MDKLHIFDLSNQMIHEMKNEISSSQVVDCGLRLELVEKCVFISFDHGLGVNTLLAVNLPIQALILLRAQFEAVVRSYWLLFIATNHQISKLNFTYTFEEQFQSDNCPMVSEMLDRLNNANLEAKNIIQHLCEFKKYHLKQLNSFVHTGKQSFTRESVGFDGEMLLTLMRQSNNLIGVASQVMLKQTIPDKQAFIGCLIDKYRQCFCLEEDIDPSLKARIAAYYK